MSILYLGLMTCCTHLLKHVCSLYQILPQDFDKQKLTKLHRKDSFCDTFHRSRSHAWWSGYGLTTFGRQKKTNCKQCIHMQITNFIMSLPVCEDFKTMLTISTVTSQQSQQFLVYMWLKTQQQLTMSHVIIYSYNANTYKLINSCGEKLFNTIADSSVNYYTCIQQ